MLCGRVSNKQKKMINGITFDLDGVYFINGKEEVVQVFLKSDRMNKEYKEGKIDDQEFWSWAVGEWGINKTVEEVVELLISGYEVAQSVRHVVKKVRANGYKTLVCSNNFPAGVNGLHQRFGFLDDFDVAVFSFEVGFAKPSKRIFRELVRRTNLKPEEIVFADDNLNNLAGADFDSYLRRLKELGIEI